MTKKYHVRWLQVGESTVPIAFDDVEHRVLIRFFAQRMLLVTEPQRSLIRKYAASWDIRGLRVDEDSALRNEPSLPVRFFDAYLWRINDPVNQGAKRRLAEFAPETPDSPGAQKIAAAIAQAVAVKEKEITALKAEVARLTSLLGGKTAPASSSPGKRASRGATRALGPADFARIRDPEAAGISDEEMAARLSASAGSVRQIREGRYPSQAFDAWLREQGIEPKSALALFDVNQRDARQAWGPETPDWVMALALACDESSQGRVALRLGVSTAMVNQVLKLKYKGRYDRIEQRVREELFSN
jgi:hypothetical protein